MKAMIPSSASRSEAHRMNRLYMSYCLVSWAVLPGDVGLADAPVNLRVLPVLVVVVFVLLVGVVRRVAEDDANGLFVLLLDADPVFLGQSPQVEGALAGYGAAGCSLPVQVVQRVHKAEVGKLQVAAGPLLVGVLDVQVGDVVGQDGDFVGVDFVEVFVLQPVGGQVVDEGRDEGARPGGWVQDLDVVVGQGLTEVLLKQVVRAPDVEVHHLVGRVDHPQPVGGCRVIGGNRNPRRSP